jgi:hypothetical protein
VSRYLQKKYGIDYLEKKEFGERKSTMTAVKK